MILIHAANLTYSIDRFLITDMATECIAGVRWICDKAATFDDACDHRYAMRLRIYGMHFDKFGHTQIVG